MNANYLISALDASLKPLGFTRKKAVWNRWVDAVVEVIDVQVSKSGDTVTVNAGVFDPTVHKTIWGEESAEFVEEPFCTVRARIGELLDQRDRWWQLGNDETVGEIVDTVTRVVLPFLQRMRVRGEMASWLDRAEVMKRRQPAELLALAVLMSCVGRRSEACELLALQRNRTNGAWRSRYDAVAQRLGCGPGFEQSDD